MFKFGWRLRIKSISLTRKSNFFLLFASTWNCSRKHSDIFHFDTLMGETFLERKSQSCWILKRLAWENSRRFTRSPLGPSQNDVWVTNAEIPYWWCVSTQILVVLLIGWKKIPSHLIGWKESQPIRSTTKIWVEARHQYGISALVTQRSFCEGSSGDLDRETSAVFSGYLETCISLQFCIA